VIGSHGAQANPAVLVQADPVTAQTSPATLCGDDQTSGSQSPTGLVTGNVQRFNTRDDERWVEGTRSENGRGEEGGSGNWCKNNLIAVKIQLRTKSGMSLLYYDQAEGELDLLSPLIVSSSELSRPGSEFETTDQRIVGDLWYPFQGKQSRFFDGDRLTPE